MEVALVEIFSDIEQGSDDWFAVRKGMPTASMFATVLASGKDGGGGATSVTRKTYLMKLAGEIITGEPMEGGYTNATMDRGKVMEEEARNLYAFQHPEPVTKVGFIVNGKKGCSPDSLVGDRGMLEIKSTFPHLLIPLLIKDEFPPAHMAQCMGNVWVAERDWIDIIVYWPKMKPFEKRLFRDEIYIRKLSDAVNQFNAELAELVERVRQIGGRAAA